MMETKRCPKCGEENPPEAVLCWACYTPFSGATPGPIQWNDNEPELHFDTPKRRVSRWWKDNSATVAGWLWIGIMTSSGWWPRKKRYWVLGAGSSVAAWLFTQDKRDAERLRHQDGNRGQRDLQSPIIRIADTILLYSRKDSATQIRISKREDGVRVEYEIGGEWRDQMKIPHYVWAALKNEFTIRAGSESIRFSQDGCDGRFGLRILVEPPHEEISLRLL